MAGFLCLAVVLDAYSRVAGITPWNRFAVGCKASMTREYGEHARDRAADVTTQARNPSAMGGEIPA